MAPSDPANQENQADAQMLDLSLSSSSRLPSTPPRASNPQSDFSPPNSHNPTPIHNAHALAPAPTLNANGKRSIDFTSMETTPQDAQKPEMAPQLDAIREASGYKWTKDEDAPGYAWNNPKALEEHARNWANIVDTERMTRFRFREDVLLKK
ncbi:hypothetical protein EJ06DRAFT_529323 [Trichodelitschia bisporula]|uniref:Uncharacterized protein n=1 Tax=Trichodelitschia bisporula TaxID=703511 RepID=A0A6G1HYR6_9PEZI|nr:hypothetical protein EJ06DRAFT_529323 [Trichodelitschia bisporula]